MVNQEDSMKKTARVIVTYKCSKKCENCCNEHIRDVPEVRFEELLKYKEIVITGGEPMLIAPRVVEMIHRLRANGFTEKIWLYTANFRIEHWAHRRLIKEVDGITYTIHFPASKKDILYAANLNQFIRDHFDNRHNARSDRLIYDSRSRNVMDTVMAGTGDGNHWSKIKSLAWKTDECPIPENEDLLFYDLEKE